MDQEGKWEEEEEETTMIPESWWVVQHLVLQTRSCWLLCERSREQGRGREAG